MKKILSSLLLTSFITTGVYSEDLTFTLNGNAESAKANTVTVALKSLNCNGNTMCVNDTIYTNAQGVYSKNITVTLNKDFGIFENQILPLEITISDDLNSETIYENLDLSGKKSVYTISKHVHLGVYTPQICIVTVDTMTNKNIIAWEREKDTTIEEYVVLSSKTIDGAYEEIGRVKQTATSAIFKDTKTTAGKDKIYYKIKAVYKDGKESPSSFPKTNISVEISIDFGYPNVNVLNKDQITTFDYRAYSGVEIYKSENKRDYSSIANFEFDKLLSFANLLGFIEDEDYSKKTYYMAVATLKEACITNTLKEDSGPYSQSLSNIAEAELEDTSTTLSKTPDGTIELSVLPTPSEGMITIIIPEDGRLTITRVDGTEIMNEAVKKGSLKVELSTSGYYNLLLIGNKVYSGKGILR